MKKVFYIESITLSIQESLYMGVGQTSWAMNSSDKKNETYVATKLFTPKSKNKVNAVKKSSKFDTSEPIPVNKNTFGLVGL